MGVEKDMYGASKAFYMGNTSTYKHRELKSVDMFREVDDTAALAKTKGAGKQGGGCSYGTIGPDVIDVICRNGDLQKSILEHIDACDSVDKPRDRV